MIHSKKEIKSIYIKPNLLKRLKHQEKINKIFLNDMHFDMKLIIIF